MEQETVDEKCGAVLGRGWSSLQTLGCRTMAVAHCRFLLAERSMVTSKRQRFHVKTEFYTTFKVNSS